MAGDSSLKYNSQESAIGLLPIFASLARQREVQRTNRSVGGVDGFRLVAAEGVPGSDHVRTGALQRGDGGRDERMHQPFGLTSGAMCS